MGNLSEIQLTVQIGDSDYTDYYPDLKNTISLNEKYKYLRTLNGRSHLIRNLFHLLGFKILNSSLYSNQESGSLFQI